MGFVQRDLPISKIFVVTLLRITKKEGIVHHEPPQSNL